LPERERETCGIKILIFLTLFSIDVGPYIPPNIEGVVVIDVYIVLIDSLTYSQPELLNAGSFKYNVKADQHFNIAEM
jgi:hypothetical protein